VIFRSDVRKLTARWSDRDLLGNRIGFDDDLPVTRYASGPRRVGFYAGRVVTTDFRDLCRTRHHYSYGT